MILSPARRHFLRKQAELQAKTVDTNNKPIGNAYELMKAALIEDRRRVHDIQSIERKIELKKELIPHYVDYIKGVIAADQGANDDVLTTLMLWCFDVGEMEEALTLAEYALKHKLEMPDQFKRSVPAIIAEESAASAMTQLAENAENSTIDTVLANLLHALDITAETDMHDQIRAKLHKAIGHYAEAAGDQALALDHYERALALNENVGVKQNIRNVKSAIKKAQAE